MTGKSYLHGIWLAEIARSTILQQQRPSFRETLYTKCISVAGDYIEKWQNIVYMYLVTNRVRLRTFMNAPRIDQGVALSSANVVIQPYTDSMAYDRETSNQVKRQKRCTLIWITSFHKRIESIIQADGFN